MIINLPFPPSTLNQNARGHWGKAFRAGEVYNKACWIQLREFKNALKGKTEFRFTFAPPDNRRRDVDNCIASCKKLGDLISKFSGIDDSKFKNHWPAEFLPPIKNGAVYLEILG